MDGIGYDLWPLSWEQVESFADYKGMISLIADAKVIYHSSEADLNRFIKLQEKAKHPSHVDFDAESRKIIESCKQFFFDMICDSNFSCQKEMAIKIINSLVFAVALINKTYTHSGWGKSIDEVLKMTYVPDSFLKLCNTVICAENADEITENIRLIISNTEDLLPKNQNTCVIKNDFNLFYEEAKSLYNKLYNACDKNDKATALMAGVTLQNDIASILERKTYKTIGFPDIVSSFYHERLLDYKSTVLQHEQCLVSLLHEHCVIINKFDNFNDFKNNFLGDED